MALQALSSPHDPAGEHFVPSRLGCPCLAGAVVAEGGGSAPGNTLRPIMTEVSGSSNWGMEHHGAYARVCVCV